MKKKLAIIGSAVLALGLAFTVGSLVTKAGSDWQSNAQNNAYSEFLNTANEVKSDVQQNINTDVNDKVNTAIAGTIEDQQAELQKLLEQYYQMRLNGLTQSPEYLVLEQKIKDIQKSVLENFKKQIDDEFAKQTSGN